MVKPNLEEFRNYLTGIKPLKALIDLRKKFSSQVFIVGGIIRDYLMDRSGENRIEIDFAVERDVEHLAETFARKIKGSFVLLNEANLSFRVILKGDVFYQFDFSQFRAEDIEKDLFLRDFTMNALALDLGDITDKRNLTLIDPYQGAEDIRNRLIRAVSRRSFIDDPLRIIRAFSFVGSLGFEIESGTLGSIEEYMHKISTVAGERITTELYKILNCPGAARIICNMDSSGALDKIFPVIKEMKGITQGPYHHLDIWRHSLETLKELEDILAELSSDDLLQGKIRQYLEENLGGERRRVFVLKLGALFHDIGKPRARKLTPDGKIRFIGHEKIGLGLVSEIAERLKLSAREKNSLLNLVHLHLRPGCLVDTQNISAKAKLRFFRAAREDSPAVILLALADKRATRGPLTTSESQVAFREYLIKVLGDYFYQKELVKPVRLLDGNETMQILNLMPGPVVGEILRELEEAQAEKKVRDRKEAEEFIRAIFRERIGTD